MKTDYTKTIYGFILLAVVLTTIGSIGTWSLMTIRAQVEHSAASPAAMSQFIETFSRHAIGWMSGISLIAFVIAIFLGVRVARHERENDEFKDQLVSIASHELVSPIALNRAYISVLKDLTVSEKEKDTLFKLDQNNLRMVKVVKDILDLSRIEQGRFKLEPKIISLKQLTGDIVNQLLPLAQEKSNTLVFQAPQTEVMSKVDEIKFSEVIKNLISNAIKYSDNATKIEVKLDQKNNKTTLSVKNLGKGIPKSDSGKLFGKFYRASNSTGTPGTGLGLFITKSIVEQSGGKIYFKSEEGKETTFYIELPIT